MRIVSAGKIIAALCLASVCVMPLHTQHPTSHHFDMRNWNLGFTMGLNYARFDVTHMIDLYDPEIDVTLRTIKMIPKPGIYLGLVTNVNLHNNIDFRFLPSVSLEQRDFDFFFVSKITQKPDSIVRKSIETSNLNFPFVFKFKSDYYHVYRVFAQLGFQYSINLASNKKVRSDPDLLKTKEGDFMIFASWGVDLYGEKLKLVPEFRYTLGIRNIYVPKDTRFATAIGDLKSQTLMFILNFE